jgi:hypothetical protein
MSDRAIDRILSTPIEKLEAEARAHAIRRHWINDRCRWCLAETLVDSQTRSCSYCLGLEEDGDQ